MEDILRKSKGGRSVWLARCHRSVPVLALASALFALLALYGLQDATSLRTTAGAIALAFVFSLAVSVISVTDRRGRRGSGNGTYVADTDNYLRRIIDLIPNFIFAKDRHGCFVVVNRAVAEYYETTVEALTGRPQSEVHPDWAEMRQIQRDDLEVIETRRPKLVAEETLRDLDGNLRVFRVSKIPFFLPSGEPAVLGVATDISQLKHSERALRESEAVLRQLAENIQQVFYVRDLSRTRMLYVSPAYEKIWGRPRAALYENPKDFLELVHREDKQRVLNALMNQSEKNFFNEEYRIVRDDGTLRWIHARTFPIRNGDGDIYRIAGLAEDITERKRADQAVRDSETRFRLLFERAPVGIAITDMDHRFVAVNRAYCEMSGYTSDELKRMAFTDISHPDDLERELPLARQVFGGRLPALNLEKRYLRKNGDVIWVRLSATWIHNQAGEPLYGIGFVENITERKRHLEKLRQSEEHFRSVFENAPVGIAIVDRNRRYTLVNPTFCGLVGYSQEELQGKSVLDITHPDDQKRDNEVFSRVFEEGQTTGALEKRFIRKDGQTIWAIVTVAALNGSDGKPAMMLRFQQDITARKHAEEERLERERQQREALVREVHHRIKNHLQGLSGLLYQHTLERPEVAEPLQAVMGQIRAVAVVHGLEGAAADGLIRLNDMVSAICRAVQQITGANMAVESDAASAALTVAARDAVALALVVNELIANAVKHDTDRAEQKVQVAVRVESVDDGARVVILNAGGPLPEGFDFDSGKGLGTGLGLVRALLPRKGAMLTIQERENLIEVRLVLCPPVLGIPGAESLQVSNM